MHPRVLPRADHLPRVQVRPGRGVPEQGRGGAGPPPPQNGAAALIARRGGRRPPLLPLVLLRAAAQTLEAHRPGSGSTGHHV